MDDGWMGLDFVLLINCDVHICWEAAVINGQKFVDT